MQEVNRTDGSERMTLNRLNKIETIRLIIGCSAWVLGLLLAGSDGPYMPWGNLLGIFVFWGATVVLPHLGDDKRAETHQEKIHDHAPKDFFSCTAGYYD